MNTPEKLYFSNMVSTCNSRFFDGLRGGSVSRILHSVGSTFRNIKNAWSQTCPISSQFCTMPLLTG
nr:hypothetical protein Iba_chr01aCG0330 [Ipomoea batatas]